MSDESQPRTLYVGNLDPGVEESLLSTVFVPYGEINGCKIIREPGNDPYAFIEFGTHTSASTALAAMNKRHFLNREMKVNWATSPGNQPKMDTSNHHHIFVGDLSPEIETQTLREAFAPFGEISNCRIVRDPQTLKSKGYAFVSFVKKAEAEAAIQAMNGQWLGSRSIRTNWSTRKPPAGRPGPGVPRTPGGGGGGGGGPGDQEQGAQGAKRAKQPTFDEVYNLSSPTNCTVYCGGFANQQISEELMHRTFSQFGPIQDVRVFKDKGYAFIRFASKEAATHAIETVHNADVNGTTVKCFWGKENGGIGMGVGVGVGQGLGLQEGHQAGVPGQHQQQHQMNAQRSQYPYGYAQQLNYWYPATYQNVHGMYAPAAANYAYPPYQQDMSGAGAAAAAAAGYRMATQQQMMPAWGAAPAGGVQQPPVMYATMQQYPSQ